MGLRWFGHVERRDDNRILRREMELKVEVEYKYVPGFLQ